MKISTSEILQESSTVLELVKGVRKIPVARLPHLSEIILSLFVMLNSDSVNVILFRIDL